MRALLVHGGTGTTSYEHAPIALSMHAGIVAAFTLVLFQRRDA